MPPSEVEKFFDGLPNQSNEPLADVFAAEEEAPKNEEAPGEGNEEASAASEEGEEPRKNRRHRRLEAQLEKEREARIAAEARAKALAESGGGHQVDNSLDPRLVRMYGADNVEAAQIHQDLLTDYATKAEERAFERMKAQREAEEQEKAQFESLITSELEGIEDEYDVDLTSNAPKAAKNRRDFLDLVEKLSPKDAQGRVTAYADFHETWELFQAKQASAAKAAPASRAKEIAARSMSQSGGNSQAAPKTPTPGFDGWKVDLGIG